MDASLYLPVFLTAVMLLAAVMAVRFMSSPESDLSDKGQKNNILYCIPLCIILTWWLGMRPVAGAFGDTVNYAMSYNDGLLDRVEVDFSGEWFFNWIMYYCQVVGMDVHGFFTVIEFIYVFTTLWAVYRILPKNPLLGMIFVWGSLMYFTFGVNGLRNGMACHMLLVAVSYFLDSKYIPAAILAILGFAVHRSIILPIAALLVSRWVLKDARTVVYIWIGSIIVSLITGNYFLALFSSLNFDDRMASYAIGNFGSEFSRTGFRWDFLLYSSFPVLLGYIVLIKKQIRENWYRVLFNTYCLANAFWVLIIRIEFSNRFAYLSWFMYPIVISYPLIMMKVWPNQDQMTAKILLAYVGFTLIMNTLYW